MNLIVFAPSQGNFLPIIETPSSPDIVADKKEKRWQKIKRGIRQTYYRLKEKIDHQENLCSQLRHTSELCVYYPSNQDISEISDQLHLFFKARYSKHSRWLCIDAILALLGIFFMPIPGPNFFFYYPAARTLGHYLARKGTQRALSTLQISFTKEPLIDQIQIHLKNLEEVSGVITELETRYHLKNIKKLLCHLEEK